MEQRFLESLEKNPDLLKKLPTGSISISDARRILEDDYGKLFKEESVVLYPGTDEKSKIFESEEWNHRRQVINLSASAKGSSILFLPSPGVLIEDLGVFYCSWLSGLIPQCLDELSLTKVRDLKFSGRKGIYVFDNGCYQFSSLDANAELVLKYRLKENSPAYNLFIPRMVSQDLTNVARQSITIPESYVWQASLNFKQDLAVIGSTDNTQYNRASIYSSSSPLLLYSGTYLVDKNGLYRFSSFDIGKVVEISYSVGSSPAIDDQGEIERSILNTSVNSTPALDTLRIIQGAYKRAVKKEQEKEKQNLFSVREQIAKLKDLEARILKREEVQQPPVGLKSGKEDKVISIEPPRRKIILE